MTGPRDAFARSARRAALGWLMLLAVLAATVGGLLAASAVRLAQGRIYAAGDAVEASGLRPALHAPEAGAVPAACAAARPDALPRGCDPVGALLDERGGAW